VIIDPHLPKTDPEGRRKSIAHKLDRRLRNASPRATDGGCAGAREVGEEDDKATVLLG
jgi:hypothetical protein